MRCLRICGAQRHASRDEVLDLIHRVEGLVLCGVGRQTRRVRGGDHVGAPRQCERGHLVRARPTSRAAPEMRFSSSARASAASSTRLPRDKFIIGRRHHLRESFRIHQILGLLIGNGEAHDEIRILPASPQTGPV